MDYNSKYVLDKPEEVDLEKAIATLNWFITGYADSNPVVWPLSGGQERNTRK